MKPSWWGQFRLQTNESKQWAFGPLILTVQRQQTEWWLATQHIDPFDEETHEWDQNVMSLEAADVDYPNRERFAFNRTSAVLTISPALADRPVIVRPITPLSVLAGEAVTMFAGVMLWVQSSVGEPSKLLKDVPIQRPSDTWFGPTPMEGELCYASRTYGRLNYENVIPSPHRAFIQIRIRNQASTPLSVERVSLPVPYLSLYRAADDLIWTQSVTLTRRYDTGQAELRIEKRPPSEAGQTKLINKPRQRPEKNMIVRAFGSIFR